MRQALVVSRYFPFNTHRVHAVYQRLGTQLQALARVADQIVCLFLVPLEQCRNGDELLAHEQHLRSLWSVPLTLRLAPVARDAPVTSLWQRALRGALDVHGHPLARPVDNAEARLAVAEALSARPDLVLAHRFSAMCVLLRLRALWKQIPLFFDMDDVEHVAWTRRLLTDPDYPRERLLLFQTPALLMAELRAARLATATFVCSESDRRYLARLASGARVQVVPNSVAFPPDLPPNDTEPLVLFVGSMGSRPNAQAVDILVEKIWPEVHARRPDARLVIIGAGAERTRSFSAPPAGVSFVGFVDDLTHWYQRARLVCCPIRHGSGTRVKIIEAAAYGKAVVSTRLGAEGLRLTDGNEIVLREDTAGLIAATLDLLNDPVLAQRLGAAARHKAAGLYERSAVTERLARIFQAGLNGRSARYA